MRIISFAIFFTMLVSTAMAEPAVSQKVMDEFKTPRAYTGTDGAVLYESQCQSCHMPEGKGITSGLAKYPALANNPSASPDYVSLIILNGLRGMPAFDTMFNDDQVAAIANYVGTKLNQGNTAITAKEAGSSRPSPATFYEDW